jgi:hypothetical protein
MALLAFPGKGLACHMFVSHAGVVSARFRCRVFWGWLFILSFIGCDFFGWANYMGTVGLDGQDGRGPQIWDTKLLLRIQHLMRRKKRGCIAWIGPFFSRTGVDIWQERNVFEYQMFIPLLQMFGCARLPTRIYEYHQYFKQKTLYTFSLLIAEPGRRRRRSGGDFFFFYCCFFSAVNFFGFLFILTDVFFGCFRLAVGKSGSIALWGLCN